MPALRQLEAKLPETKIVWRAFELRPDPVPMLDPAGEYLTRIWNDSVYPLAKRLKVSMNRPPIQARSRLAHEAAHWARQLGNFSGYNEAVFRAFFERGEDIGSVDVLMKLATDAGLDGRALKAALIGHEYLESVMTDEHDAATLGIGGVPAFIADRKDGLSGVQSLKSLIALVEGVRQHQ